MTARRKLVYLITEDWFFLSHFLERAVAARDAGWEVAVACREGSAGDAIRAAGFAMRHVPFRRRGLNPLSELGTIRQIARIYRAERPDLVHHIALKPIIFGAIAARRAGVRAVVNAPVGMGFVFTSARPLARLLRPGVRAALRASLGGPGRRTVFENPEDRDDFVRSGLVARERTALIAGAGVDLAQFAPRAEPPGPPVVVLAARMLDSKGVREFVEAARLLRSRGVEVRMQLAGGPDPGNPESIGEPQLRAWAAEGAVEWLGHRTDMPAVYAAAHIACLPSYREGLPKALLEAMAAGLPVVSTDVVGCRYAVTAGETGLLVPARDAVALAEAIARLAADADLRRAFGAAGRKRAEAEFASGVVVRQTLELYESLMAATER